MSDTQAILQERARLLARPLARERNIASETYVTFHVGNEVMALETSFVRQIVAAEHIAALPGAARPLIGVTGWRGELLPVFDLGAAATHEGASARLIVVGEDAPGALLVDAVDDLVEIAAESIHALAPAVNAARPYARGITADTVLVLDGAELLRTLG